MRAGKSVPVSIGVDLVHNSIIWLALSGLALLGAVWSVCYTNFHSANDEAARITSNLIAYSLAHVPYVIGLWAARLAEGRRGQMAVLLAVATLLRLSALFLEPILSEDWRRYRWEAATLDAGINPYRATPTALQDTALQDTALQDVDERIPGRDFAAVYGPVLEGVHWAGYKAGLPLWRVASFAEVMLLAAAWIWMRRNGASKWRWAIVAWSPLHLFEFWGSGHNDAWLVLLVFTSALFHQVGRNRSAAVTLAFAVMTKWWPVLLLPTFWRAQRWGWGAVGLFGACLVPLAWILTPQEWIGKVRFTTGFLGGWQNNAFLYHLLTDKMQAIALILVWAAWVAWQRRDLMQSIATFAVGMLAVSANIHPWYQSWYLVFVACTNWNPMPWVLASALLPLLYDPVYGWTLNGIWKEDLVLRGYVYTGIVVGTVITLVRHRRG
jgi:hypothetical protein